jgi:gliding motility-associated-like protein
MLRAVIFLSSAFFLLWMDELQACDGTDVAVIVKDVTCNNDQNGSITVRRTFGSQALPYSYSLNGSPFIADSVFNNLDTGVYVLTVRNSNGCDTVLSTAFTINQPPPLQLTVVTEDVICGSDGKAYPLVSGGVSPYLFRWQLPSIVSIDTLRGLSPGTYQLQVLDQNGCAELADGVVNGPEPFAVSIKASATLVDFGGQTDLRAEINRPAGSYTYQWFPENLLSCNECAETSATLFRDTEIRVFVRDVSNGCRDTDTLLIQVEGKPTLFIPNAFSPNGDRRNDFFTVYGVAIRSVRLKIYDSRGFLVYEGDEGSEGWDGLISGNPAVEGVYYYLAEVTFLDQTREVRKGQLSLIR